MAAVEYPSTLPGPSLWGGQPLDRAARSSRAGNTQLRGRSRDALHDLDAAWQYTAPEMAIWRAWYEEILLNGMLWFSVSVPGPGGWVARVLKYRTNSLRHEPLGNGVYRVSAKVQQRGLSALPASGCFYEMFVEGLAPYSTLSGSGALFTLVASPYGQALHYLGVTSATVSAIRRSIPSTAVARFRCRVLVESASVDDAAAIVVQTSASALIAAVVPRREAAFDASQRVQVICGAEAVYVGASAAALNTWYEATFTLAPGAGNSSYSVVNLSDSSVLGAGAFAGDHAIATAAYLKFNDDPSLGSAATRFASIEICEA